jgi:signal transduction histidine kinase
MPGQDPLLDCEGEMAVRLGQHDWSTSPLGPIESWSQSLRTTVAILLRSRYPMLLSWGEHLVMLYNDDFIPTLGTKHPGAVGGLLREQFAEVWSDIGAMQESVLRGGPATWDEDLPLTIERGSGPEEFFFTFSYSHVPDEDGPGGVLAVLTVTTDKVVAARRLGVLNELATVGTQATAPDQALQAALGVLGNASHDLAGGAIYTPSPEDASVLVRTGMFGTPDAGLLPALVSAAEHPVGSAWSTRQPVYDNRSTQLAALPLRGQDEVESVLVLLPHPLRPFDKDHERFVGLVADQVGQILAVATARAREQARLEALAAIDAAKTAFLSSVSHEFRTPLTLLLGPLEDVLDGRETAIGPAEAEVMHSSAHRLLRMVNALLDVAHIEADGLTASPEPTDLAQITRDLLQAFDPAASRAGLVLEIDLDPALGLVLADPELWEKIVLNLVANAIKFTREGSVRVTLENRDEQVVLRVADTGVGIPESDIGRVFDRFHRVHDSGSRSIEGTGVGLSIVADAARAMGGSVTAESRPGVGSTFEVVLPLTRATGPFQSEWTPKLRAARALAAEVASGGETASEDFPWVSQRPDSAAAPYPPVILVVDDNVAMRSRVGRVLTSLGRVTTVADGVAALEVLRSTHVDLVVTDAMMPRLDGLGLLEAIRRDEKLRSTPVVVLSARAGPEAATGAIDAGADDYVVKPFTPGELLARCRTSLELADYRATTAASQMRNALLAGVSHDMQTPLAVITTSLGLLGEPDIDQENRTHIASRARARSAQLTRLVTQFLDWSRLNMNQPLPVRIELVDLTEVVAEVASEHERVRVTGELERAEIWCDRQRTEQILHNLVENAERVARTSIEIRLTSDEETVAVRIADDGPGVSPQVLPWLFEAFGPTTATRGNGLGLHVSREAAKAQGGTLALESTSPDGSVFALHIPRQEAPRT